MIDFTLQQYRALLHALINNKYEFQTFDQFIRQPKKKVIILRHDVDLLPYNSLDFAKIQSEYGIKGTYYFRAVPESWDTNVILEIADLGHEIGYHYECLTTTNGDMSAGISDFESNLSALRALTPVSTICMHGSPLSKYDSKKLWSTYKYQDYDIIGEPYFDIDFNDVFYLTDTGRKWDGQGTSVRDKVKTKFTRRYRHTPEIIEVINAAVFPDRVMFTFHPQRWNDNIVKWGKELVFQNVKNVVKKHFFVKADV
ncbi:polysaccharide deacetylase family protein [Aquimarina pacifica]|uniref:hypothetical protein n=1 Tax=Aquimarina pacifica TaxID=1296415 RepID=UPI0004BC7D7D|nr:hypothetical protein [Aquimarina pacifica]